MKAEGMFVDSDRKEYGYETSWSRSALGSSKVTSCGVWQKRLRL